MTEDVQRKTRAVAVSFLLIVSLLAMTVGFSGKAAASTNNPTVSIDVVTPNEVSQTTSSLNLDVPQVLEERTDRATVTVDVTTNDADTTDDSYTVVVPDGVRVESGSLSAGASSLNMGPTISATNDPDGDGSVDSVTLDVPDPSTDSETYTLNVTGNFSWPNVSGETFDSNAEDSPYEFDGTFDDGVSGTANGSTTTNVTATPASFADVSKTPVREGRTVTHEINFSAATLDGATDTDQYRLTVPGGAALNMRSAAVTYGTTASTATVVNSRDLNGDGDVESVTLDLTDQTADSAVSVDVNVTVEITWPTVSGDTTYAVTGAFREDTAGGTVPKIKGLFRPSVRTVRVRSATVADCGAVDASGGYRLSGDVRTGTGGACLAIEASDVTIDGGGNVVDGPGSGTGLDVDSGVSNVTLRNVTLTDWGVGVDATGSDGVRVVESRVADVGGPGIDATRSTNLTVRNVTVARSDAGLTLRGATAPTVRRLRFLAGGDTTTVASLAGTNVSVSGVSDPPPPPGAVGVRRVGGHVRVESLTADARADIAVRYDESDLAGAGVEESSLRLGVYDGTAWVDAPNRTRDATNDTVGTTVTNFSVFAPLGSPTARVGRADGSGVFDTRNSEGFFLPGATVFRGEADVSLAGFEATPTKVSGTAAGTPLQLPIPPDQPTGVYADGAGNEVTVATPRVTALDVRAGGTSVAGGSVRRTNADSLTVLADWTYRTAEDLRLTVRNRSGTDVTGAAVTGGDPTVVLEGDSAYAVDPTGTGTVAFDLDLAALGTGTYTVAVQGADDLTGTNASATATVTVESTTVSGGGGDDDDTTEQTQEQTKEQTQGTEEADVTGEPTETRQTESGSQVTSQAEDVQQGDRVAMDTATQETANDPVAVSSVEFTSRTSATSMSVTVTQSTSQPPESPDFRSDQGTQPTGYVDVQHTVANDQVSNVEVTFRVRKDRLGPQEEPDDVSLYRAEEGSGGTTWNELPTQRTGETSSHYVFTANSPGLSNFVVGVKQAQFRIAEASISVAEVRVRERTEVVTRVTNTGGADGTFVVELIQGNETVATRTLTIAANGTRQVAFGRQFTDPGQYDLYVNDAFVATVTVRAPTPTPTGTGTGTATPGATPTPETSTSADAGETDAAGTATPTDRTPTAAPTTASDDETSLFSPGFGPLAAVVALVLWAAVWRRRQRQSGGDR